MTMNRLISFSKRVLSKIIRLCKLDKLIYKMTSDDILQIDDAQIADAREFLQSQSPNPMSSCICKNQIDEKVDVHIIVPAYNVEKYIKQCLDSVVLPPKKYTYFLTVINDGSIDGTADILREYENIPNVEIITQSNKGFSGARNTGLKNIRGKYILFLDSDDYLDWSGVEKLLDTAFENGSEVVSGSVTTVTQNGEHKSFFAKSEGPIKANQLGGQPWAKVFKSNLFENLCFPENYWYEDSICAQIIYPQLKTINGIRENTYYYRVHDQSITSKGKKSVKSIDSYWVTERLHSEREKFGLKITEEYYDYILHMVVLTFSRISLQSYEIKKNVFILFSDFINRFFAEYTTSDIKLKEVEKIIKNKNLGKCIAFVKWIR